MTTGQEDSTDDHHDMAATNYFEPSTSNDNDTGAHDAQRYPDRNLAMLLGLEIRRQDEDQEMSGYPSGAEASMLRYTDEDGDHSRLGDNDNDFDQWRGFPTRTSLSESQDAQAEAPLGRSDGSDGRKKGKVRQKLGGLMSFRRRKAAPPTLFGRAVLRSPVSESSAGYMDPFGDENAAQADVGEDSGGGEERPVEDATMESQETHDDGFPSPGSSSEQWVTFSALATPIRAHSSSAPTTPRRSPWSTKSRSTPGSAKSWLSNSSEISAMSSLRRKTARRKARNSIELNPRMRSMKKSIQLLGPEAAGAVAQGTDLSPNKLRYMAFGRQMRDYMRRHM